MNTIANLNKADYKYLSVFSLVVIAALFPFFDAKVFSIDDYHLFYEGVNNPQTIKFSIESGRWFGILMYKFFALFMGDATYSGILFSYLSVILQYVFCALIIAKQFNLDTQKLVTPLIVALGFIHAFSAEILTFKIGLMVNIGFTGLFALSFYAWYVLKKFDGWFILGVVGITLSLATYQVIINVLLVITVLGFILGLNNTHQNKTTGVKIWLQNTYSIKLIGIALGTILYLILNKIILLWLGLNGSLRGTFITLNELQMRLTEIYLLYKRVLFDAGQFLQPIFIKQIFLAVLLLSLILVIVKNTGHFKSIIGKLLFVITVLALAVFGLMATGISGLFLQIWWMVPRMFTGIGLFTMFVFLIAFRYNNSSFITYILTASLVVTLLSHINLNHKIANEQAYLNDLDRNKAQNMLIELEKIDDFKNKRLYIHQRNDCWVNDYNLQTNIGDMNLSAFCASWSKYKLLQHVGGIKLIPTTTNDNLFIDSIYNAYAENNKPIWPAKNSIWTNDSLVAIFP